MQPRTKDAGMTANKANNGAVISFGSKVEKQEGTFDRDRGRRYQCR
jgi:hypothetical protein